MEFIAEIADAALLGDISATIGNQCAGFAAGGAARDGRVDASMAACMGQK